MSNTIQIQNLYDKISKKAKNIVKDNFTDSESEDALATYLAFMVQEICDDNILSNADYKIHFWKNKDYSDIKFKIIKGKNLSQFIIDLDNLDEDYSFVFDLLNNFNLN